MLCAIIQSTIFSCYVFSFIQVLLYNRNNFSPPSILHAFESENHYDAIGVCLPEQKGYNAVINITHLCDGAVMKVMGAKPADDHVTIQRNKFHVVRFTFIIVPGNYFCNLSKSNVNEVLDVYEGECMAELKRINAPILHSWKKGEQQVEFFCHQL